MYWNGLYKDLEKVTDIVITAGFKGNVEITAVGADKGKALKFLCDEIGVDMKNVMHSVIQEMM